MSFLKLILAVLTLIIFSQTLVHAKVSPVGLTLSELKTAIAKDKDASSPLEKGYSSDYRFYENYGNLNSEIQIWVSNNKVIKAQWVYGGKSVNTSPASKKEFDRMKKEFTEKYGKPILDTRTKDGYVTGWDNNEIAIVLGLELPTTKYGLPILKVIETVKGSEL